MTTPTGAITTLRTMHIRTSATACTCGRLRCAELAVLETVPLSPAEIAATRIRADQTAAAQRVREHLDNGDLEPIRYDNMGSPIYSWQIPDEDG